VKVYQAVGQALAETGTDHVFGLLGSGNFAIANALVSSGARFFATRHETAAVTMADAFSRVSGKLGVCTVHQGPGLTNAITGLAEAAKSRTPLLLLAAEPAASAIHSNFRIDQAGLVRSVDAICERLYDPRTAVADALRAAHRARVERRPVVLMMPLDIQGEESKSTDDVRLDVLPPPVCPTKKAVDEVAERIGRARRPLILAGRGAVLSNAGEPLQRLGDQYGALLSTSAVANGLFAGNRWSLGISGGFASPLAAELIAQADVVLAFGVSLNMYTTRHGHLISPEAVVIQVDDDPAALGARHRIDVPVVGDVGETARALLAAVGGCVSEWRTSQVADRIRNGTWLAQPYEDAGTSETIDPRTLSIALDELLPSDRAVAVDAGHFMGYPPMYLGVEGADAFVFTQGFQSIGLGLASALGAAVARRDRITVAALGDGGALMAAPEFETVARLGLPVLIVIYNDAAYSAEVHHFGPLGQPVDLVKFPDTDFAAVGRSFGLSGITVRRRVDLEQVREWTDRPHSGLVVDAKVEPTVVASWSEESFRGH
jgi:thiamine pyrophosphate-dependent acetolactate synthase large subunit-like protein